MERMDLGHGHFLKFVSWVPDRDLNPQFADIPNNPRCGANIWHPNLKNPGQECVSYIGLDPKVTADAASLWQIESWDPLTLSPSLLCTACGDHGHIRNGRWEPC